MIISLIRIRRKAARVPGFARGLVAGMALSLAFVLTPCCGIFGEAYAASTPGDTESHHAPAADNDLHSHKSEGGGICGKWLDSVSPSAVIPDGALMPSWEGKAAVPSAPEHYSFVSHDPDAARWRPLHSQSPPYALYLRFTRLLL
ncbi:MAG: hypothetical protein HY082_12215 [Gammaproteobacteria bacterium]|nr:hypothetical protein [Gammaproteobacteria bacterium]